MRIIKDYSDFYYNNRSLSEMKGKIINQYNTSTNLSPNLNVKTINIPGKDGEVPTSNSYDAREWKLDVFFYEMVDTRTITNWLSSRSESEFYYIGDDVKINAMILNVVEAEIYKIDNDNFCGIIQITFKAFNPYYYLIDDTTYEITTTGIKEFINKGNRESEPNIRFELVGTQNIKFKLNNITYEVENAKDYIEINTKTRVIRDSVGIKRQDFKSDGKRVLKFPALKVGLNTFQLVLGSMRRVNIKCNSIYI